MKNTIIGVLAVAALVMSGLFFIEHQNGVDPQGGNLGGDINVLKSGELTTTSVLCGTTSTLLVGTSTAREYLAIVNDGSNNIYLELSNGPAVLYEGIRLNSGGGSYEIDFDNLYTGPVYCIADTSAASTTATYK